MHAHSEHLIDGEPRPVEVHYVHQGPGGKLAVVGVFFTEPKLFRDFNVTSAVMSSLIPDESPFAGDSDGDVAVGGVGIDLGEAIRDGDSFYHYKGSLTTPPCSKVVEW